MLLVCFDGGEPRVVEELIAAGKLPNLAALAARGSTVQSASPSPLLEECTWGTFLTGLPVGDFALAHFLEFEPRTMGLGFRREIENPGFWEHLPDDRRRVVIDPPEIHPYPGSTVESSCGWHHFGDPVHPPLVTSERLESALSRHGEPPAIWDATRETTYAEDCATAESLLHSTRFRFAAALDAGRDAGFLCIGGQELHSVTHCLGAHWVEGHWHNPQPRDPSLVLRVYEATDDALGPLLDEFADGSIAIVFTHGMRPGNRGGGLLEELLARAGILVRRSDSKGRLGPGWVTHQLRSLLPEGARRRLAKRLLPRDVQHRLASRRFRDSYVWDETLAFPVPGWTTGFIRANVRGREALGIVPPEELDALLDRMSQLLLETVNAETGEPLVRRVVRAHEAYPGALAETLPDLLVDWYADHPSTSARHPELGLWSGPLGEGHMWTSHSDRALAFLAGPRVRRRAEPVQGDAHGLAPTLLTLLDTPVPHHLTGELWDVLEG